MSFSRRKTSKSYDASVSTVLHSTVCGVSFLSCRAAPWRRGLSSAEAVALACHSSVRKNGDDALRFRGRVRLDKSIRSSSAGPHAVQGSVYFPTESLLALFCFNQSPFSIEETLRGEQERNLWIPIISDGVPTMSSHSRAENTAW